MNWFWVTQSKTKGEFGPKQTIGELPKLDIGIHSIQIGKKSYKTIDLKWITMSFYEKALHHHHHHILFKNKMTTCGDMFYLVI